MEDKISETKLLALGRWINKAKFKEIVAFKIGDKSFVIMRDDNGLQEIMLDGDRYEVEAPKIKK